MVEASLTLVFAGRAAAPVRRRRSSAAAPLGLLILLLGLVAPDCCLNGSHAFGAGMDSFGAICRSRT